MSEDTGTARSGRSQRPLAARRTCSPRSPGMYLLWSLVPVLVAVIFSFNAGRSRSAWQGFSLRWYVGDPSLSVWHDARCGPR